MFSVVLPVYNHAEFLTDAVGSALRSPLVQEVLMLDDGSTDGSAEIAYRLAEAHPGRVRDVTPRGGGNRGAHCRLNELVELAACEWIAVLNSDDVFVQGRFEAIAGDPDLTARDFVFGNVLLMSQRGSLVGAKRGPEDVPRHSRSSGPPGAGDASRFLNPLFYENYLVSTSNMVFRKELHARVGGFADYRYVHDWDFALRAVSLGRPLHIARFLTAYRWHSRNTIREEPRHSSREAEEMFNRFRSDFPEMWRRPEFREGYRLLFPHAAGLGE